MMIFGKSVLGLITARGGSKGIPRKNILQVGGKPLLQWTIDSAKESQYLDRIVLSSDDEETMTVARAGGCEVPFQRDQKLAMDDTSSIEVIIDALERLPKFDIVVLLQPTSPLRTSEDIDGVLEEMHNLGAPACVTVRSAIDHPYLVFNIATKGNLTPYINLKPEQSLRRQDLPPAWCLNGAVFAAHTHWLMLNKTFLSPQTIGYRMPDERSLDIDTPEDIIKFQTAVHYTNN